MVLEIFTLRVLLVGYWLCVNLISFSLLVVYLCNQRQSLLFRELTEFGKLRSSDERSPFLIRLLRVPKRWFSHFYVFGVFYCLSILGIKKWSGYSNTEGWTRMVALLLLLLQMARRLVETSFISVFSNSTMHIAHYILGLSFYLCTSLTIGFEPLPATPGATLLSSRSLFEELCWYQYGSVILFIWASYHQFTTACILAGLRQSPSDREKYAIPHGDWFSIVSCPHYLQEVLIYVALFLAFGARSWVLFLQVLFVFLNQTLCALQSQDWYRTIFGHSPAKYCLIPWVI